MSRYLLKISFDGTAYHGWQVQNNAVTIQEIICNALSGILKTKTGVTGCSRTDAGVHAKEFYCHFDSVSNMSELAFVKALNSVLPNDISVLDCKLVPNDFHARYNAKGKNYIYNFFDSETPDPFLSRYSCAVPNKINVDLINEFCKEIIGTYDFAGFSSSKRTVEDTVRTVYDCSASRNDNIVTLSITANGFLYNMVRIIAGTALSVSNGKINPKNTKEILLSLDRDLAGPTLTAKGLFLNKVIY